MKGSQLKFVRAASLAAAIVALGSFGQAYAQDAPPPVDDSAQTAAETTALAPPVETQNADSNTFHWKDVPTNQQIVVDRAVFDQGGYVLYCHTGETIVVPFADHNLYVMKFGRSDDGSTYFVNDGSTPTLYVPEGGYLENAAAEGAKWYPFPDTYNYTSPVYVGVAPDWNAYVNMAWYPGMYCCGGYCGYSPYVAGVIFAPMPGFYVSIFDQPYYGWYAYRTYYYSHPAERAFFRTAPVFRYDRFPSRGPAYYAHTAHTFGASPSDRDARFGARPNPVYHSDAGRPGAFGNAHFGSANPDRAAGPSAGQHVWGPSDSSGHPTFGMRLSSDSNPSTSAGESARKPFGGLPSLPAGSSRSSWGDGSAHSWGSPSRTYSPGSSSSGSSSWGSSRSSSNGGGHTDSGSSHSAPSSSKDPKNGGH